MKLMVKALYYKYFYDLEIISKDIGKSIVSGTINGKDILMVPENIKKEIDELVSQC